MIPDPTLLLALAGATALLCAIPGPNVALIVANTLARGAGFGVVTVLGTTCGIALQLIVVVFGLAALLELAAEAFTLLKWAGVAYLLYLGLREWRQGRADAPEARAMRRGRRAAFWQGLLLALINPKTLVFNAAFLPQFVAPESGLARLALAAGVYVSVMFAGDLIWVATAGSARPALLRLGRLRHRLTGALFFLCGIGLALSRTQR